MGIFKVLFFGNGKKRRKDKVLDLRPKQLVFRITWKNVPIFLKKHTILVAVILLLVATGFLVARPFFIKASVETFYPTNCLGGWENVHNAEGEPQISSNDAALFNGQNSAYLDNKISQVFCGNFKGVLPQDTKPKKIMLHLSWAVGDKANEVVATTSITSITTDEASTSTATSTQSDTVFIDLNEDFSSSERNAENPILNGQGTTTSAASTLPASSSTPALPPVEAPVTPTETITPISEPVSVPTPEPVSPTTDQTPPPAGTTLVPVETPTPAAAPESTPTSVPTEAPVAAPVSAPAEAPASTPAVESSAPASFIDFLIPRAYAQSLTTETSTISEIATTVVTTTAASSTVSVSAEPAPTEDPVFTILYTLDGKTWNTLGITTRAEIGNKNFEIPIDNIQDQTDLSNIQINIQSAAILDQDLVVYLDGMSLTVQYGNSPIITQEETDTDTGKLVTITATNEDPEAPLVDVLASTTIPRIFKVGEENRIHIKWKNNGDQNVSLRAYDKDKDGYLDYVEWTVPHLSEQIFEIIFISKAFQLDSNQNIIADIYDKTVAQDGNWASISDGQYVRVTFNEVLDNTNDNTIYARPTDSSSSTTVEVYPVYTDPDGNVTEGPPVAVFDSIDREDTYKILLTNLQTPTDVFDLKVVGGSVDFDYIVDPTGWLTGWTYRKKITIQNANVSADLTDFPVYIDITGDTDIGAVSNADGFDHRFTASDGTTLLKYERESFAIAGGSATGNYWVKTNLTTAASTDIYIYYRAADTADGADPTNVWDGNFKAVYHLNEASWNGTTGEVKDSTGVNNGKATNATIIAGKIGSSGDFDGTGDYVVVPSSTSLSITGAITVSMWINRDAHQDFGHPLDKPYFETTWSSPYINYGFEWGYTAGGTQDVLDWLVGTGVGFFTHKTATANYTDTWFYAAGTYTGSNVYIQINATKSAATALSGSITASGRSLVFGAGTADGDGPFNGAVDEIRISNKAREDAWLKFEYYNQSEADNELTWGGQETASTPTVSTLSPADGASTANIDANLVITFSEAVTAVTGNITIKKTSDNSVVETISATSSQVTGTSTDTITIDPAYDLNGSTEYYVQIDATAFDSLNDISYAGISDTTTWNFTTNNLFDSGWTYRKKITIQNANVSADLTDFPVYVDITGDTDIGAVSNADGFDHRFTASDGTTLLKYERESFAIAGGSATGNYWVKTNLTTAASTDIYIYYRAADTADGADPTNVWDANFKAVWHMSETSGTVYDSTVNNNDLSSTGSPTYAQTGKVNKGITLSGSGQYLSQSTAVLAGEPITMTAWFKSDQYIDTAGPYRIVSLDHHTNSSHIYSLYYNVAANVSRVSAQQWDGSDAYAMSVGTPAADTNWHYAVGTYINDASRAAFFDGANKGTDTTSQSSITPSHTTIGVVDYGGTMYNYFDGTLDEIRISDKIREDAWVKFEYYNMGEADNELTWGAQDDGLDSTPPTFTMQYYSDSGLSSTIADNAKLKDGTYYVKISANEALSGTPTVSIAAEGTANDVTDGATTAVSGNDYKYTRTISADGSAVGSTLEDWSVTGTDSASNTATNVSPTNEATKAMYTDIVAPTNQDTVFAASISKVGGASVTIVSSGDATNNVWFALSGTTNFVASATTTTAGGTATSILAPATAGAYRMYVIDAVGNISTQSTAILTVDNTAPTAAVTYSLSRVVKSGDSLTITATFNEPLADSPVVKIAISGSNTLAATNMTKTDTTHYYYTHTVDAGDGTATVALSVGTDAAGNAVTSAPTSGSTFTVDNTNPAVTITSPVNNSYSASTSVAFAASATDTNLGFLVPNLDSSLVSWWRMDDVSSGNPTDYVGGNNLTKYGDAVQTSIGKFGKSFYFDGTGDFLSNPVGSSFLDYTTQNFTLSGWFRIPVLVSNRALFFKGAYLESGYYVSVDGNGRVDFITNQPSAYQDSYTANGAVSADTWFHVIVTRNGSTATIYINGNDVTNTHGTHINPASSACWFIIGGYQSSDCSTWSAMLQGYADEAMVFNRVLTADEITALYNATAISHSSTLSEAAHTYKVYSSDTAGNVASSTSAFTVDATPPATPSADPVGDTYADTQSVTLSSAGSSAIYYTTNGDTPTTGSTLYTGAISIATDTTLKALAVDAATNQSGVMTESYVIGAVSCSVTPSVVDFGILDGGSVNTSNVVASTTMSCGSAGCTLFVQDAGNGSSPGLYSVVATSTPLIPSVTATLAPGSEGYGIQAATTTAGSGETLILSSTYFKSGNAVGGLSTAATAIASSTSTVTNREVLVTHKAAISGTTPFGSYADTITYSCVGN